MRVVIDPGHGGTDPGAVNNSLKLKEASVALNYALLLKRTLISLGHSAVTTRVDDNFINLADRCEIAGAYNADLFISLHCNAAESASAKGIEVWTSPGQTSSDDLATAMLNTFKQSFPGKTIRSDFADGDADRESKFYVLIHTAMPAVLVELGFISNSEDAIWLTDMRTISKYCDAIALSIAAWEVLSRVRKQRGEG